MSERLTLSNNASSSHSDRNMKAQHRTQNAMKYERLPRRRQFRDERLMKQKRNTGVLWVPLDSVGTIAPEGRAINAPHKICQPTLQQCCTVHVQYTVHSVQYSDSCRDALPRASCIPFLYITVCTYNLLYVQYSYSILVHKCTLSIR